MKQNTPGHVEWISGSVGLGQQEEITPENAIQVAREEVGPCYSRWADDCLQASAEGLQRVPGLNSPECLRLRTAMATATVEDWNAFLDDPVNTPFCPGFFDWDAMPNGRGLGTGTSKSPSKKKSSGGAVALGAGIAALALALALT